MITRILATILNPLLQAAVNQADPPAPEDVSTEPAEIVPGKTYDLRKRYWGHDYTFDPIDGGQTAKISGWLTPRVEAGDYLILKGKGPQGTRYQITKVENCRDPHDMFFAEARYVARHTEEDYTVTFVEGYDFDLKDAMT